MIASGIKTVEVRKTRPKLETPFKCYIYETYDKVEDYYAVFHKNTIGKIVGEFICNKVNVITHEIDEDGVEYYETGYVGGKECMSFDEIKKYLGEGKGYGWYISELKIYVEPKGLYHFFKPCGDCDKKGTKRCTEESSYCRAKPCILCYGRQVAKNSYLDFHSKNVRYINRLSFGTFQ